MGTSVYPGALDNFAEASPPYLADDDTTGRDHPARHDDLEAAMEAVQGELGTDPSGGSATVKARLDAADSTVASKAPLDSPAFTGTVNFTGTSVIGLPVAGLSASPPSSIANSGGTASLAGNTVTFTGVSSVSLNGCFTGDYDNYRILARVTSTSVISLSVRLRASGVDNTSAVNTWRNLYYDSSVVGSLASSKNYLEFGIVRPSSPSSVAADLFSPAKAEDKMWTAVNREHDSFRNIGGISPITSAFDGMTVSAPSGTMTGTVSVYGYKS